MLTSRTRGARTLSNKEAEKRNNILLNPENYSQEEIDAHDMTDLVRGHRYNKKAYEINTSPADTRTQSKKIDLRTLR